MKYIKENWPYFLIFVLFALLASFFPLTSTDLRWVNIANDLDIKNFYNIASGKLLSSAILLSITKYKILKILTYGVLSTCLFVLMKNIVNKKNMTLMYIGIFLFLLLGSKILSTGYVWTTGFVYNFIGALFILIYIYLFIKNTPSKMNVLLLFLLGLSSSLINPYISIVLLILLVIGILYRKKMSLSASSYGTLIFSIMFGLSIMMYYLLKNEIIVMSPKFVHNLLHEMVPILYSSNFLIVLILLAFLLFLCIKIYLKGDIKKRIYTIISMVCMSIYALVFILNSNDILNYVFYILFTASSLFVLLYSNNSILFKKKIVTYFIVKIVYIFVATFIPELVYGDVLLPLLLDILIILEIVNYIFPSNFLEKIWISVIIILIGANIYLYKDVFEENRSLNYYIKNHLECETYDFSIPSKYDTEFLYRVLPETLEEKINYVTYYDIAIDKIYNVYFNE